MTNIDIRKQKLSFYGRLADEITRDIIPASVLGVTLLGVGAQPLVKADGYFVFSDIPASTDPYSFHLAARGYQARRVEKSLPPGGMASVAFDGEDELVLSITAVQDGEQKKVSFAAIPFLKPIPAGAAVYGENGFSTTLAEILEGEDIQFALLRDVTGLAVGRLLRVVRSENLVMRPGPYYPFKAGTTVVALALRDGGAPGLPPVANGSCTITEVNDIAVTATDVNGLDILTVTLGQDPLILGPTAHITASSDSRGNCVFYYPPDTPIGKLRLTVSADGYVSQDVEVAVTPAKRVFQPVALSKA